MGVFWSNTPEGSNSMLDTSGRKFCCRNGTLTAPSRGDRAPSDFSRALHWTNRAFGLAMAPLASTRCQSDQVLSGVPVLPVRVDISMTSPAAAFHDALPHDEIESVSFTFDSYVPDVATASPIRNSFPMFAEVA